MDAPPCPLIQREDGVLVHLHIQPKAKTNRVVGFHGGRVKVMVAAPPVDGAANAELLRFVRRSLDCASRDLELESGLRGRRKTLFIRGVGVEEVRMAWGLPAQK